MRTSLYLSPSKSFQEHRLLHLTVQEEMIAEFDGTRTPAATEARTAPAEGPLNPALLDKNIQTLQKTNSSKVKGLLAVRGTVTEQQKEEGNVLSRIGQGLKAWWNGPAWVAAEQKKAEEKIRNSSKEKIRAELRKSSKEDLREKMDAMMSTRHYAMKQIAKRSNEAGMELELLRADMGHAQAMLEALNTEKAKFEQKREMYQTVQNMIDSAVQVTVPGLKETEISITLLEDVQRDLETASQTEESKNVQDTEAVAQLDERHKLLFTTLESYLVDQPGELIYLEKYFYENAVGQANNLHGLIHRLYLQKKLDNDQAGRLQQLAAQIRDPKNEKAAGVLYGQMLKKKTETGKAANSAENLQQTMTSFNTIGRYQQFDMKINDSDFRSQWTVTQVNGNYMHIAGAGRRALINTNAVEGAYQMLTEDGGVKKFYQLSKPEMKDAAGKLQRDFVDQTVVYLNATSEAAPVA